MTRARDTADTQDNVGGSVPPFAAGKNKFINGDFYINQRAFTSTTTNGTYGFDRWYLATAGDGSTTYSAQTFTPGTAPVAGYEGKNFARLVSASQTTTLVQSRINQAIEDVRTFAGQTVTVSFWAKASSGTPSVAVSYDQYFGSGGSPSADVEANILKTAITTSWARYSATVTIPSISGKTIGTNNNHALYIYFWTSAGSGKNTQTNTLGIQSATIDFWGIQLEAGSVATPFQTATGTIQGELAACQRYFYRHASGDQKFIGMAAAYSSSFALGGISFPSTMRTTPTLSTASGTDYYLFYRNSGNDGFNSAGINQSNTTCCSLYNNSDISSTAGHGGWFITNNASATVDFSAEL